MHVERDAEVHHHRPPIVQQNVLGLDVAVDNAVSVRVVERVGNLARDPYRFVDAELRLAVQLLADRLALDVGHHVIQLRLGGPHRVNALGPGANLILPSQKVVVGLKFFQEFANRSTVQGRSLQIATTVTV
jgi:hypothetical protein